MAGRSPSCAMPVSKRNYVPEMAGAEPLTGTQDAALQPELECTRDSFHRGGFEVLQPVRSGHRAGSDALLLAAALPENAKGLLADLGAGAGVAGLAALAVNPLLEARLVEFDRHMAQCARLSLQLPANAALASRAQVIEADVTLGGRKRTEAGLADNVFDFVISNPPYYNPASERSSPDARRALAHQMGEGDLEAWLRTGAAILKPGGMLCLIWRSERLDEALGGLRGRFGAIEVMGLHPHAGEPAPRLVIRAVRGSRAPLRLYPGVVLHEADNAPSQIAQALLNGLARLPFGS